MKPSRLDLDQNSRSASMEWSNWRKTFKNYAEELDQQREDRAVDKLILLINCVSHTVYEFIEECETYDEAITALQSLYVHVPNEIFARHLLATTKQQQGQTLDEFLQTLRRLSKDCNFRTVTTEQYKQEMVRDAFINGLLSHVIRQMLLENRELDLATAFEQARTLDLAQKNSEAYDLGKVLASSVSDEASEVHSQNQEVTGSSRKLSFFCGFSYHDRKVCPAKGNVCHLCKKKGHFAKVCRSKNTNIEHSAPYSLSVRSSGIA